MRKRTRRTQGGAFPVTPDDWRDARHEHEEDSADRRTQADVERTLDTHDMYDLGTDRTTDTRLLHQY